MREIKFRAWDKANKEMFPVWQIQFETGMFGKPFQAKTILLKVEHELNAEQVELMQYTGLKDKNGKEIFEGDIWTWQEPWEEETRGSRSVVTYESGKWNVAGCNLALVVVIGNIYENPELLKEEADGSPD